ncbi:MAG: hypothetical protein ABII64_01705 [Elusimicrobiota bacterium]
MVETLFAVVFLTTFFFAAMQFIMVSIAWLRANEAAQAGLRCAIVSEGSTVEGAGSGNPNNRAQTAVSYILGFGLPAKAVLWDKIPAESARQRHNGGQAGRDHSSGPNMNGANIRMFSLHVYYFQKLMFSSFFSGMSAFGMLNVSDKYGPSGAAHCRMIKPPDWRYYEKAYPEAYCFNE